MDKDVLSLFVKNEFTTSLIKKILTLALILLLCTIICYALDLIEWNSEMRRIPAYLKNSGHNLYLFRIAPVIHIVIILAGVIGNLLIYNGYERFLRAVKSSDPILLNKAFQNFYTAFILGIASFSISIINMIARSFINR